METDAHPPTQDYPTPAPDTGTTYVGLIFSVERPVSTLAAGLFALPSVSGLSSPHITGPAAILTDDGLI